MRIKSLKIIIILLTFTLNSQNLALADEMIIGDESISNIDFVFEAAPKDTIYSDSSINHLKEKDTDIHIEALITWSKDSNIPGQIPGSHLPYLDVEAMLKNERTGEELMIKLLPHINLSDGYHYARNLRLPGNVDDIYSIRFLIESNNKALSYHYDWKERYAMPIIGKTEFMYKNLDFLEVSRKSRR